MSELQKFSKSQLVKELNRLESSSATSQDIRDEHYLRHDLEVHQIELEMQNRELREKQRELELAYNKYADLYDFAPVGYMTLDANGVVRGLNLTATKLFKLARTQILGRPFNVFLVKAVRRDFLNVLLQVLRTQEQRCIEIQIQRKDNTAVDVLVQMTASPDGEEEIRVSLQDISERKLAEYKTLELLTQNRHLTQRLFHIQEEERRHLAQELHDEFGQWLTAIRMHAHALKDRNRSNETETEDSVSVINDIASKMSESVRNMIHQLRPIDLVELGLKDSLRELVDKWRVLYPKIYCTLSIEEGFENLNDMLNISIYRLIQESLTNVAKHSKAEKVSICLRSRATEMNQSPSLYILIEDDGIGFDLEKVKKGIGLAGMRERVLAVGGEFKLRSSMYNGVHIEARLPVTTADKN